MAGKLDSWGVIGTIHPSGLVQVIDSNCGASYLVDTGSTYSILPYKSHLPPTGPLLKATNGQKIPCWGKRKYTITFGGCRYTWYFLLAAVDFNIIGVDFLQHFKLSVDVAARHLWTTSTTTVATAIATATPSSSSSSSAAPQVVPAPGPATVAGVKAPSGSPATSQAAGSTTGATLQRDLHLQEEALLADFEDVLNTDGRLPPSTHRVEHHIVTSGCPVTTRFWRLDNIKLAAAKAEFLQLEKEGIVRRCNSD